MSSTHLLHLYGAAVPKIDYRGPAYWRRVEGLGAARSVILEPTPAQLAAGVRVLPFEGELPKTAADLVALAGRAGWSAMATRSRFLDVPAVSGKYKGQYAEKVCAAIRLEHRGRMLIGAAFWLFDVTAGAWKADDGLMAQVVSWAPRQVRGARKMNVTAVSAVVGESEKRGT